MENQLAQLQKKGQNQFPLFDRENLPQNVCSNFLKNVVLNHIKYAKKAEK